MNTCTSVYVWADLHLSCVLKAGHRGPHFNDEHNFPMHWTAATAEAVRS